MTVRHLKGILQLDFYLYPVQQEIHQDLKDVVPGADDTQTISIAFW